MMETGADDGLNEPEFVEFAERYSPIVMTVGENFPDKDPAQEAWDTFDPATRDDDWYKDIIFYLLFGNTPSTDEYKDSGQKTKLKRKCRAFVAKDGHLYRRTAQGHVRCVSQIQVPEVLYEVHDCDGHWALRLTFNRAGPVAWWPSGRQDII
jgi:hypothetical protein